MNKQTITTRLSKIGACWAIRSDKFIDSSDGWDAKPTYHIHPNADYPYQQNILRFSSLKDINEYINMRLACKNAKSQREAEEIYNDWKYA